MAIIVKGGEALGDIVMYRVGRRHCRLVVGSHASRAKLIRGIDWATVLLNECFVLDGGLAHCGIGATQFRLNMGSTLISLCCRLYCRTTQICHRLFFRFLVISSSEPNYGSPTPPGPGLEDRKSALHHVTSEGIEGFTLVTCCLEHLHHISRQPPLHCMKCSQQKRHPKRTIDVIPSSD